MENFELSPFINLSGISSPSGLVFVNDHLYVISDNSNCLYDCNIDTYTVQSIVIYERAEEKLAKDVKPDFESITYHNDSIFLYGSGSTDKRNAAVQLYFNPMEIHGFDLTPVYSFFKQTFAIPDSDFNIEGAFFYLDYLHFVQRGNGTSRINGIFRVNQYTFNQNPSAEFFPIILPKINGVNASFTDAIVYNDSIFFLATAEDSNSTYEDGKVYGSMVGIINTDTFVLEQYQIISNEHKFEGLTLYHDYGSNLEFLLCEDNDTDDSEATIYKLFLEF